MFSKTVLAYLYLHIMTNMTEMELESLIFKMKKMNKEVYLPFYEINSGKSKLMLLPFNTLKTNSRSLKSLGFDETNSPPVSSILL